MTTREPVRLYAPERYKIPELITYAEILFPFWGVVAKDTAPYIKRAEEQYQYSKDAFVLVDRIEDCDYVMLPYQYYRMMAVNPAHVHMIHDEAKKAGKLLLVDGSSDLEPPISLDDAVIMRISQYRYTVQPNEITIPFAAEDLLESYCDGKQVLRDKSDVPSIGFTGWAQMPLKTAIKNTLKELPVTIISLFDRKRGAEHKGVIFRKKALESLAGTNGIHANFNARKTYSGHVSTIGGGVEDFRKQFVDNLLSSDYALCVRGDGNTSIRFYEALSLGRIPLFLDTACVLPLEDEINYREFCVFVKWQDVSRIGEIVRDFHAKCDPQTFRDMQEKARNAYKNYLRFDAFSYRLAGKLRTRADEFYKK
jgi:hypothetical protein